MIPQLNIDGLNTSQIEQILSEKSVVRATTRTINKLAATGTTAVKRSISGKYVIKQKDLVARKGSNRNGLRVNKAKVGSQVAYILGGGLPLPVFNFRVSPKSPEAFRARKRGKGVDYTVRKGSKVRVRGAFVARMSNGHVGVFLRKGKSRTPIRELFGPSIPQMLSESDSLKSIEQVIATQGPKIYTHELRFELGKFFNR